MIPRRSETGGSGREATVKKERDIKFIVGMTLLTAVILLMIGSFWRVVARQAEIDKAAEAAMEEEAIKAICVEVGEVLKRQVFVDLDTGQVFSARVPKEGIYNRNGVLIRGDVLELGDKVRIVGEPVFSGDPLPVLSGIQKMERIERADLAETEHYSKIAEAALSPAS